MSYRKIFALIDDDLLINKVNTFSIQRSLKGFEVINFSNGAEAYQYFSETNFTSNDLLIILLDLNMPVMNGWEFLDVFPKLNIKAQLELYVLSSSIDPFDKEKARSSSIVKEFLTKPLSMDFLATFS
ncbi:response regulator [Ekhidna sp. To15]|uniref:response regulator n=1 Tax=Ekhidna sp. To15 TaxID=3395267 RepID=UPI003F51DD99